MRHQPDAASLRADSHAPAALWRSRGSPQGGGHQAAIQATAAASQALSALGSNSPLCQLPRERRG